MSRQLDCQTVRYTGNHLAFLNVLWKKSKEAKKVLPRGHVQQLDAYEGGKEREGKTCNPTTQK